MPFSQEACQRIAPIYAAIRAMPFIRELAAGTLSEDRFRFYILQDARYLVDFARALALCAVKAPDPDETGRFLARATNALNVERSLHEGFLRRYGIDVAHAEAIEPSPTCLNYLNFLLASAYGGSYSLGLGAVLPCFWIYWEIGREIRAAAAPNNPYQPWIDTYGDPEFGMTVEDMMMLADRVAEAASSEDRTAMLNAFHRAAQFEWMFWNSAYWMETWPIP